MSLPKSIFSRVFNLSLPIIPFAEEPRGGPWAIYLPIAIFVVVVAYLGWVSFSSISSIIRPANAQAVNSPADKNAGIADIKPPSGQNGSEPLVKSEDSLVPGSVENTSENSLPDSKFDIPRLITVPVTSSLITNPALLENPTSNDIGWGNWSCLYCTAVPAKIKLTHYWPPLGGENCWSFHDAYCYSPTKSSIPWETVVEIGAACTRSWLGTIVEVPSVKRRFLCVDTGFRVNCKEGICVVDVLSDKLYPWDGNIMDAVVYYPKVWVEGNPATPTPSP